VQHRTGINGPPISYSVNGKQYVAVLAGARQPTNILQNLPELRNTSTASMNSPGSFERISAFAKLVQAGPARSRSDFPLFTSNRDLVIALAARYGVPAIYQNRDYALDGGLISYGASQPEAFRLGARYVGQILKGAKPADRPVQQSTKLDLVINLKTAKALGLEVPPTLLALADEVIQ